MYRCVKLVCLEIAYLVAFSSPLACKAADDYDARITSVQSVIESNQKYIADERERKQDAIVSFNAEKKKDMDFYNGHAASDQNTIQEAQDALAHLRQQLNQILSDPRKDHEYSRRDFQTKSGELQQYIKEASDCMTHDHREANKLAAQTCDTTNFDRNIAKAEREIADQKREIANLRSEKSRAITQAQIDSMNKAQGICAQL